MMPHTAARTVETISQFGFEQLPHPLYSADLTSLKEFQLEQSFPSDDEVKSTVGKWLKTQSKDFFAKEI